MDTKNKQEEFNEMIFKGYSGRTIKLRMKIGDVEYNLLKETFLLTIPKPKKVRDEKLDVMWNRLMQLIELIHKEENEHCLEVYKKEYEKLLIEYSEFDVHAPPKDKFNQT